MKTILILGLIAGLALVAPVATAHIVIYDMDDECGSPSTVIPGPVHAWVGLNGCPFDHGDIPETLVLPLP
jgi:hypothetical protein